MTDRTILHVDMNSYFASCEQQADPSLRGKPIVVSGKPHIRSVVASASKEAKKLGVKSGMSTWEAKKVCPSLIFIPGDPEKYIAITNKLFTIFHSFTPYVEFFSVDEAFLDVTSTSPLFGGAISIANSIKKHIKEEIGEWLTCSIGISFNKFLAKLASDLKKPDGLVIIDHNNLFTVLYSVDLTDFCGIGERIERRLNNLGIFTVSALAGTPVEILTQKFGIYGETLHNMSLGIDHSPIVPTFATPPPKSYSHAFTLPFDTRDFFSVKKTLYRLSEKVGRRLRHDGFGAKIIHLYLRFSDFDGFSRQKKLGRFVFDGKEIYKEALGLFPSSLSKAIRMIAVGVSDLSLQTLSPLPLFPEDRREQNLLKMMDLINDRFGEFTIGRASYLGLLPWEKTTAGIRTRMRFI